MDHRVLENFQKMLVNRGYTDIKVVTEEALSYVTAVSGSGKSVRSRFTGGAKLNIGMVKECINEFVESKVNHGIIVFDGAPTSQGKKMLQNLDGTGTIRVELFPSQFFQQDITKHKYVRPHIKLSKRQAKEVKDCYGLKLPILLASETQSRYHDFRPGDIVKIIRRNNAIAYRLVK